MEILNKYFEVKNISKSYDTVEALKDISFDVKKGEFISFLGPSGCGKSTLLKILIGILKPDSGSIIKDSVDITSLDAGKRKMGIVFQNYALFPNMTALRNVEYALSIRKETKATATEVAKELLIQVGLENEMNRKPNKLSGGQQQRVAIARTLALNPDIVLFDEPMSALDVSTRLMLRDEIKRIQKKFGITIIYITHDQEEAFSMSDRVIVMSEGHIEQFDTPIEIMKHPANKYVQEFVVDQLIKKVAMISNYVDEIK